MFKLIIVAVVVTIAGLFVLQRVANSNQPSSITYVVSETAGTDDGDVQVEISGEVLHPSTYSIASDKTLADLISLAGGVTDSADPDSYTPTLTIGSHTSFYIPRLSEDEEACKTTTLKKININTASKDELVQYLNSAQASALISYRQTNGPFTCIEDIMKVSGIGEKTYLQIRDHVCLQ
jgi:competence protein ComEA